jgi:uncharacterized protein YndB with AHSA1/START domain
MKTMYSKDPDNKKIFVTREFAAPVEKVWEAWTTPALLEQWWAPKPWKANTVSMDFREGGEWMYYMEGPDGTKSYCKAGYDSIIPNKSYKGTDFFCDEQGNKNDALPLMQWYVQFDPTATGTKVDVELTFDSIEDLQKITEMGFEEGFAMAHENLDALLASK